MSEAFEKVGLTVYANRDGVKTKVCTISNEQIFPHIAANNIVEMLNAKFGDRPNKAGGKP